MARQRDIIDIEQWRAVPWWPLAKVSSHGRVIGPMGRVLKPQLSGNGYHAVYGHKANGKAGSVQIHRLVALVFLGSPPAPGMVVHHRNNRRHDNHLWNLEWVTPKQNMEARHAHGTMLSGEDNPMAKLTVSQVRRIRHKRTLGATRTELCKEFGVSWTQVHNIISYAQWRHI